MYKQIKIEEIAVIKKWVSMKTYSKKWDANLDSFFGNIPEYIGLGYVKSSVIDIVTYGLKVHEALKNLKPIIAEKCNLLLKDLSDSYAYEGLIRSFIKSLGTQEINENDVIYFQAWFLNMVNSYIYPSVEDKVKELQKH